jgi:hypothetical protein
MTDAPLALRLHKDGFAWLRKALSPSACRALSAVLRHMLFVRVHLDDSTARSGAMEIAPGTHKHGIVRSDRLDMVADAAPHLMCEAAAGDILVLLMLVLHRSAPAQAATARRVLRLDYATRPLPAPLRWVDSAAPDRDSCSISP